MGDAGLAGGISQWTNRGDGWLWLARIVCWAKHKCFHAWAYSGPLGALAGLFFSVWWALELVRMTCGVMKSIDLVATALLVVFGHGGDAASLLPKHMASTVRNSAGQTQTNKINVARQCAATWSPVLQCHIDPDCSEKQQTCQLYWLGYGGSAAKLRNAKSISLDLGQRPA